MQLPSFRLCVPYLDDLRISNLEFNEERKKYNKSEDFSFYSQLLKRKLNAEKIFECGVRVEFYEFTDGTNEECHELQEYVEKEIHLRFRPKGPVYEYCFSYNTKKILKQKIWLKRNLFMKISCSNYSISNPYLSFYINLLANYRHEDNFESFTIHFFHYSISFTTIIKFSETYLENPYKFQCSYYEKSQNPFNSVSHKDCVRKCLINNCLIEKNCFIREFEYVFRKNDSLEIDSNLLCDSDQHRYCLRDKYWEKCEKICPIDCFKEEFRISDKFYTTSNFKNFHYSYWDSKEPFISYEETPNMLLIDYFTYIGGLFGLWFGICLENLFELIVKHTRNLKTKVKLKLKKLLLFIYIFSICFLHCINDLIINFINCMRQQIFSINNRTTQFRTWFIDWLGFIIDLILSHAKTFFFFTLSLIISLILLFLSFVFCSKSMFETQVNKVLLLTHF
jgi:hypothetical protein